MKLKSISRRALSVVFLVGLASCSHTYQIGDETVSFTSEENSQLKSGKMVEKNEESYYLDEDGKLQIYDFLDDCWLTTICCGALKLSDNCWELRTLRRFRDQYVRSLPKGENEIQNYYRCAQSVSDYLKLNPRKTLLAYFSIVLPCAFLAEIGRNRESFARYKKKVLSLYEEADLKSLNV